MEISNAKSALEQTYEQTFPALRKMFTLIEKDGINITIKPCEKGIELRFLNDVHGMQNRAHLRIFFPAESKCVLFFHKKSSVPFSHDRFSYGGVVIDARSQQRFEEKDIEEWLNFLVSGLSPAMRPGTLKKSLPYTIPED